MVVTPLLVTACCFAPYSLLLTQCRPVSALVTARRGTLHTAAFGVCSQQRPDADAHHSHIGVRMTQAREAHIIALTSQSVQSP